jgi:hypothetical protein
MSNLDTFLWGMGGALLAYVAMYVLPLVKAKAGKQTINANIWWLEMLVLLYVAGGGLFAWMMGDAAIPKHAAFYGIGWDVSLKGAAEGAQAISAVSSRPRS